jgi:hypothetical protein
VVPEGVFEQTVLEDTRLDAVWKGLVALLAEKH